MEWNCVKNRDDIKELFNIYDDFHDSCIVSLAYKSGNFVDSSNAMCFGNRIMFLRCSQNEYCGS